MASRDEIAAVTATRDDLDTFARALGHQLTWRLGEHPLRRGYAYRWDARCEHCGAAVSAFRCGSSCLGIRDARHDPCSGPGTAVLTEIEEHRVGELITQAVRNFGWAITPSDDDGGRR